MIIFHGFNLLISRATFVSFRWGFPVSLCLCFSSSSVCYVSFIFVFCCYSSSFFSTFLNLGSFFIPTFPCNSPVCFLPFCLPFFAVVLIFSHVFSLWNSHSPWSTDGCHNHVNAVCHLSTLYCNDACPCSFWGLVGKTWSASQFKLQFFFNIL